MDKKFCKFYKIREDVSHDCGETWQPTGNYETGDLYEELSADCGGGAITYRWVNGDEYYCEEIEDKIIATFTNGEGYPIGCEESLNSIGKSAVEKVEFKSCLGKIPNGICRGYNSLIDVDIESGITEIGGGAFQACNNLESIEIPDTITKIHNFAFANCGLFRPQADFLPSGVTEIGEGAFTDTPLNSIVIPSMCTRIGEALATQVTTVSLYDEDKYIFKTSICESIATSLFTGAFNSCYYLSSVTFNDKVEYIGGRTFNDCINLLELSLPSSVKGFGVPTELYIVSSTTCPNSYSTSDIGVCKNCLALSSVTLNNGLEYIGNRAFENCTSLSTIDIPESVENIYRGAFKGCTGLTSITVRNPNPPKLGGEVFDDTNYCPIYVPADSVEAYKSEESWSDYKGLIHPINNT